MTMVCEHAKRAELSGYADGELPARERQWWDDHLRECPACRDELGRIQALGASLRSHLPPREPSSAFRDELRRVIRGESQAADPVRERPRGLAWARGWAPALAATLLFALGLGLGRATGGGGGADSIVAQVVAGHVRSLEVDHLVDIASSEHHVVKPWFAGKLDFSPPVPDLAADSFPLIGARVDYLAGRAVAALVYERGPHRINLLVWPGTGPPRCDRDGAIVSQGFNLAHGHAAGMEFWAISDLNQGELEAFVRRWQREAAPGGEGCGSGARGGG
jgi:anti-sigma factor RsiW